MTEPGPSTPTRAAGAQLARVVARARAERRTPLGGFPAGIPWAYAAHLALGLVVGVLGLLGPLRVLLASLAGTFNSRAQVGWMYAVRRLDRIGAWERARFRDAIGVDIPAPREVDWTQATPDLIAQLRGTSRVRRQLAYWTLRPALSAAQVVVVVLVIGWPIMVVVSAVGGLMPGWVTAANWWWAPSGGWFSYGDTPPMAVLVPVVVVAAFAMLRFVAPRLIRALTAFDCWVAQSLVGADNTDELALRVSQLRTSRTRAVDSAERERTRIERDLHDGAQQRLVNLSILLGRAEIRAKGADPALAALVTEAKAETRTVIAELRSLTRGLHPPVLTDRGLDAALSGIAARSPIPTVIDVAVDPRPSQTIEAVLYFTISELLTNAAKHSQAHRIEVRIHRDQDRIVARVRDDGIGGADQAGGTGIPGLRDRLAGVDGTLIVTSPPGGPTVIEVEVPCASS